MHDAGLTPDTGGRKSATERATLSAGRAFLGCALLTAGTAAGGRFAEGLPLIGLVTAFLQAAWPLWHRQQVESGDVVHASFVADAGQEVREAWWLAALMLPAWAGLAAAWFGLTPQPATISVAMVSFSLSMGHHWLVVAAPEEWFWRGYLQPALANRFDSTAKAGDGGAIPWRRCLPVSAWATSSLFALVHFVGRGDLASLTTFLPSLAFSALRNRRGRLLGSSLLHAACNATSTLLLG